VISRFVLKLFIEIVFWAGIVSSFMRTADLFQNFAPSQFAGYSTVGWYGIMCAISIESLIVISKYYYMLDPEHANTAAQEFSVKAGLSAWALSFAAQGLDGIIVRDAMDTLSPIMRDMIYWIVPAVPLIVSGAIMIFGTQMLNYNPSSIAPKQPNPTVEKVKHLGSDTISAAQRWVNGIGRDAPKTKRAESPKATPPTQKAAGDSAEILFQ